MCCIKKRDENVDTTDIYALVHNEDDEQIGSITYEKVTEVIEVLKIEKAAAHDRITAEMLRKVGRRGNELED